MKKLILLFLTLVSSAVPLCAQGREYVFLDVFKHPLYINGLRVGTTNRPVTIPTDYYRIEVIVKRGRRYYGYKINLDLYRYTNRIDLSAVPRIRIKIKDLPYLLETDNTSSNYNSDHERLFHRKRR